MRGKLISFLGTALLLSILLSVVPVAAGDNDQGISLQGLPLKGHAKLDTSLNALAQQAEQPLMQSFSFEENPSNAPVAGTVRVIVECVAGQAGSVISAVGGLGTVEGFYGDMLQISVPAAHLTALAENPQVNFVRQPMRYVEAVTSEGVALVNADDWQAAGYDGTGVKVGILDGGFAGYSALLGTELPGTVTTHWAASLGNTEGSAAHGTACAEIVYDMAPGATFYLANCGTLVEMGEAVDWMIAQGVQVISCSIGWPTGGPGDGTGPVCDIVDTAHAAGILWAQAAGNMAMQHWEGTFQDFQNDGIHDFISGDNGNTIVVTNGDTISVALKWNDGWGTASNDYDLILFDNTPAIVAASFNVQNGNDEPWESLTYQATYTGTYHIGILRDNVSSAWDLHLYSYYHELQYQEAWNSIVVPGYSPNVMTVGAVDVTTPDTIEPFSSRGIYATSVKPDIVAPDGVSTASYGASGFYGTSAAAPHTAGAAVLVKQCYPGMNAAGLQYYLKEHAIFVGSSSNPGNAATYGSGRLWLGDIVPGMQLVELDFGVTDATLSSDNSYLCMTEKSTKKVHILDTSDNSFSEIQFAYMPESITPSPTSNTVFVALLTQEHDDMWFSPQNGFIAEIDPSTSSVVRQFEIDEDPYDIVVTSDGYLYVSPGSGQWDTLKSYSLATEGFVASVSDVRQSSHIALHPNEMWIYAIDQDIVPNDIRKFSIAAGTITALYDSPYHGQYALGNDIVISADGNKVLSAGGSYFSCTDNQGTDIAYTDSITSWKSACFHQTQTFYTLGAAQPAVLRTYAYDTMSELQAIQLSGQGLKVLNGNSTLYAITTGGSYATTSGVFILPLSSTNEVTLWVQQDGSGTIAPPTGNHHYELGTIVNITATPDTNWAFVKWTGDVGTIADVNAATTTITMNGNYSITANFIRTNYILTMAASGNGAVTPAVGDHPHPLGTVVDITATPDAGWVFSGWALANGITASETFRPNGPGSETAVDLQYPAGGSHFEKVDDTTADGDATYIENKNAAPGVWQRDLFTIPAHTTSLGTVTGVTVHAVTKHNVSGVKVCVKTHGVVYEQQVADSSTYILRSSTWNVNPFTGTTWTWDEIDALEIGVALSGTTAGPDWSRCTQLYATVDFTSSNPIADPSAATTTITMYQDYTVTAIFTQPTLTVSVNGNGTVTPTVGAHDYSFGESVAITANPDTNWAFVNWTGDTSTVADVNAASTTITMNDNYGITANFVRTHGTLTMQSPTNGSVLPVPGTYTYPIGSLVSIDATPAPGYTFFCWAGNTSTVTDTNAASTTITIDGDYTIYAHFMEPALTIGVDGGGTVTPSVGTHLYPPNTVVDITATPSADWVFTRWTGDTDTIADINGATTTITVNGNCSINALFTYRPPAAPSGGGGGGGGPGLLPLPERTDANGALYVDVRLATIDHGVILLLPAGTNCLLHGFPASWLGCFPLGEDEEPPLLPENHTYYSAPYQFKPEGIKFSQPVACNFAYDPDDLPEGYDASSLLVMWWDPENDEWVPVESEIDVENGYIRAYIAHFSLYALMLDTLLPDISITDVTISPPEIYINDDIIVTVTLVNQGTAAGDEKVSLILDGDVIETQSATVEKDGEAIISFTLTGLTLGDHTIEISDSVSTISVLQLPAVFECYDLSVTPEEVDIGQDVQISVIVANTGGTAEEYAVVFRANATTFEIRKLELGPGEEEEISATISFEEAGKQLIEVNGLLGTAIVRGEVPKPEHTPILMDETQLPAATLTEEITPDDTAKTSSPNWLIIGLAGGGLLVAAIVIAVLLRRRK